MKIFERTLILLITLHFVLLLATQTIFHHLHLFPQFNQVTKYEGVNHQLQHLDMEVLAPNGE